MLNAILGQCPCSGGGSGGGGGNGPLTWVLVAGFVGLWMMVGWTRRTWKTEGATMAGKTVKIGAIVAILLVVCLLAAAPFLRQGSQPAAPGPSSPSLAKSAPAPAGALPRLVDLGAKSCIPCKMMAPILEELKRDYAGRFDVEFVDVWVKENAVKAEEFGIRAIPTQIFFDASGKELWRHEGYFSKEAILAKWKELGYDFSPAAAPGQTDAD